MLKSTQDFIRKLDEKEIRYENDGTSKSGKDMLTVSFNGKNIPTIKVSFFFDSDNESVALRCFNLAKVPEDKIAACLVAVNQQNKSFRFARFVLDTDDSTIQMEMDAVFRDHDVGEICYELMVRAVSICEKACPEFMKAIWS